MSTRKISSAPEPAVDYFREPLGFLQSTLLVLLLVGSLEMGFLFNTVCSYALMTLAFYEMIQVQIRQDKEDRIQIKSNWVEWYYYTVVQFYMVSKTWLTPELLHASGVVLPEVLDDVIFRYHSFYSFCLLSFGLMFFVLSLEEGFYAYQFKQFGWSLLNIAMIVLAGHGFLIGLWRIRVWWAYTLACLCFRDIVDNVVSKLDPVRIPLHSLSPQHTLFGFLVSATAAFTFYFTVSFLFPYLRPILDRQRNPADRLVPLQPHQALIHALRRLR